MRKSITLFDDQYAFYKELKSEKLLVAFVEYMFEDIEPEGLSNMEQVIWNSLLERMDNRKGRSDAGSKGGSNSHGGGRPKKQAEELQKNNKQTSKKQAKNNQVEDISISRSISRSISNKIKEEDNKKNKFLDFVYLTEHEHQNLISKLGQRLTDELIDKLNNYIGSIGKDKYKSHYYTILQWSKKEGGTTTQSQAELMKERERQRIREEAQAILSPNQNENGKSIQTESYNRRTNFKSS